MIRIQLNERSLTIAEGTPLSQLRADAMPDADVVIYNGHQTAEDVTLLDGDQVVLWRKGRQPSSEELEALLVARHTPEVHRRVKNATVGIAGLGGLGSAVAIALARTGVGRLKLVDYDIVEPSNINRQQYFLDQLGKPKAEALAETLARINPFTVVEPYVLLVDEETIFPALAGCDVLCECFDDPATKAMFARVAAPLTPVVAASGMAGYGSANEIHTRRAMKNLILVGDETSEAQPGRGLMAPRVGVAAHHQANAVLRLLLGEEP